VRPSRHGIVQNTLFRLPEQEWRFEASGLHAPTLWERASASGLVTAAVSWPVTVGASIDLLIPELPQYPEEETWLELARRHSTPGLVDEVVATMGGFGPEDNQRPERLDRFTTAAAVHVLKTWRPNLLLLRLVEVSRARQVLGLADPVVDAALLRLDARVGDIAAAALEAGIQDRTTFVITGGHGIREAHTALQPNVILRHAGLLEAGPDGSITSWRAAAQRSAIRLADPEDEAAAERVRTLFHSLAQGLHRGTFRLVEREELDALGADPGALFFLEASPGYAVNERFECDSFLAPAPIRGYYGFLPSSPGMRAGLLLAGAGIREGASLPIVRQVDLAPTVARVLGFEMPETEGVPLVGALKDSPARPRHPPP
jgi:Type I phosphodiesterase / nucleotide pyrophosphatase